MTNIILTIFLTFSALFSSLYSKETGFIKDNKIEYFIAKQLFFKKRYAESDFFFNKIIKRNYSCDNKYFNKSKIYRLLIKLKFKKKIRRRFIIARHFKNNLKYRDLICYIYAVRRYNSVKSKTKRPFHTKETDCGQINIKRSLKFLKVIKKKCHLEKIEDSVTKLVRLLKTTKLLRIKYQLKFRKYIAVINRTKNKSNNVRIRHPEDFEKFFLKLKSYNEIYLDNITKFRLSRIKKI